MSHVAYLVVFLSIIIGLGVTDLLQSLRELIRPQHPTRWHWLPLLWCFFVLLGVANIWWANYNVLSYEVWTNYFAFLSLLAEASGLYLVCALSLPDVNREDPEGATGGEDPVPRSSPIDLEKFYFSISHRRWFFGVGVLVLLTTQLTDLIAEVRVLGESLRTALLELEEGLRVAAVGVGLLLIHFRRKWVHAVLSMGLLLLFLYFVFRSAQSML